MQQLLLRAFQVFVRLAQRLIGTAQFTQRPTGDHHADAHALAVDARRTVRRDRHDAVIGGAQRTVIGQMRVCLGDEHASRSNARFSIGKQIEQRSADQFVLGTTGEQHQRRVDDFDPAIAVTDDEQMDIAANTERTKLCDSSSAAFFSSSATSYWSRSL